MKYWFKRKRYGYGWIPTTKPGWFVVVVYILLLLLGSWFLLRNNGAPRSKDILVFVTTFFVATGILLSITHYTAPKPKWRWGKKPYDDSNEDY